MIGGPPVTVRDWMDLFTLDPPAVVECPDCEERSPELGSVYAAARWVEDHERVCPV